MDEWVQGEHRMRKGECLELNLQELSHLMATWRMNVQRSSERAARGRRETRHRLCHWSLRKSFKKEGKSDEA